MKICILGEARDDEAAIKILVDGILSVRTELLTPERANLLAQGWPSVLRTLPNLIYYLRYKTGVDALVVVVDSDETELHEFGHDTVRHPQCRLCQLRSAVENVPLSIRSTLKIAIGLAVPAIEAWLLCPDDTHLSEATWARRLQQERITYSKNSLKEAAYGTSRPPRELKTKLNESLALRLAENLPYLEQMFPGGFGSLANDLRNW